MVHHGQEHQRVHHHRLRRHPERALRDSPLCPSHSTPGWWSARARATAQDQVRSFRRRQCARERNGGGLSYEQLRHAGRQSPGIPPSQLPGESGQHAVPVQLHGRWARGSPQPVRDCALSVGWPAPPDRRSGQPFLHALLAVGTPGRARKGSSVNWAAMAACRRWIRHVDRCRLAGCRREGPPVGPSRGRRPPTPPGRPSAVAVCTATVPRGR